MKLRFSNYSRLLFLAVLAAICTFTPTLRADWASIRANNYRERRPEPTRAYHVERAREWRHADIEAERRQAFYWAGFVPGTPIQSLPQGYVQVSAGATGYYYYDGVYFRPTTTSAYEVVAPPVGALVPQLPSGAEAIAVGPTTYYYAAGAFYFQQPNGFAVMPAPMGVTVTSLPAGAAPVVIKGTLYYAAGNVYFLPVMQAGITVYVTAHP